MQPLRARRLTLRDARSSRYVADQRSIPPVTQCGLGQSERRQEPETFGLRALPDDPYTAWLEQREAEHAREDREQVRWVFRPRPVADPGIRAANVADQQAEPRRERGNRQSAARLTAA